MPARRVRIPMRSILAGKALKRMMRFRRRKMRAQIYNPQPTFTETFLSTRDNFTLQAGSGVGKCFKVSFNEIPQHPQYTALYKQYRINWVKVIMIPNFDTKSADINSAFGATGWAGLQRIVYAINDSPDMPVPASEQEVLTDNGAKIRSLGSKWTCSFKPVPDISVNTSTGVIPTKLRNKQWFNYDDTTLTNNPLHGSVSAYVTVPGTPGTSNVTVSYSVYYKVNFSLRDPQ